MAGAASLIVVVLVGMTGVVASSPIVAAAVAIVGPTASISVVMIAAVATTISVVMIAAVATTIVAHVDEAARQEHQPTEAEETARYSTQTHMRLQSVALFLSFRALYKPPDPGAHAGHGNVLALMLGSPEPEGIDIR
jgi:hypothetical protein